MTTLVQELCRRAANDPKGVAQRSHHLGLWEPRTWADLEARVTAIADGLAALGVKPGDRVALVSWTSADWIAVDLALQSLGAVTVAMDDALDQATVIAALRGLECRVAFVGDEEQYDKVMAAPRVVGETRTVIVGNTRGVRFLDGSDADPAAEGTTLARTMAAATQHVALSTRAAAIGEDQVATIIVGEPGQPARTLTHGQLAEMGADLATAASATARDVVLSVRCPATEPERQVAEAGSLMLGYPVAFGLGGNVLIPELVAVQPTLANLPLSLLGRIDADITRRADQTKGLRGWALRQGLASGSGNRAAGRVPGDPMRKVIAIGFATVALALAANAWVQSHASSTEFNDEIGADVPVPATKFLGISEPTWWLRFGLIAIIGVISVVALIKSGHAVLPFIRKKYGVRRLRAVSTGGDPVPDELLDRLWQLGVPVSTTAWNATTPRPVSERTP